MSDLDAITKLDALRRLPDTWIQLICNSRTPQGSLAWSLSCKYGTHSVQYVSTSLTEVVTNLETHLRAQNLAAPAVEKRKLKLKRSTS